MGIHGDRYFKIKLIRKIGFLSEAISWISVLSLFGTILFYMFLVPSDRTPGEIKVLFFIKILPVWLQYFIVYSIFIFPASLLVKKTLTYADKGIIFFDEHSVRIRTRRTDVSIPEKELFKIIFVDKFHFFDRDTSWKFIIQTTWDKFYRCVILEDDSEDEVCDFIAQYKNERLAFSTEVQDPTENV